MYSYELDNYFRSINMTFNKFNDFNSIVEQSSQVRYNLKDEDDCFTYLNVFTTDNHHWGIKVMKERVI